MVIFRGQNGINCYEARLLMSPYMENDPVLTQEQCKAFEAHLLVCSVCQQEYEEDKQLIALVKNYWGPISEDTRKLLEEGGYSIPEHAKAPPQHTRPMTVEESWKDLKRRSPSLAEACHRQEEKDRWSRLFSQIGTTAAAASILTAMGIGWIGLRNSGDDRPTNQDVVATHTQARVPASAMAELATSSGRQKLPLGQPIDARGQPQEVVLGGKHRVVMNTDTVATFDAIPPQSEDHVANGRVAYNIQLAQGELYVEVASGHAFTVKTNNARLDITGTAFDVRADDNKTELILLKGSVRFSQLLTTKGPHGAGAFVDVTAGHASSIIGRSAPSAPRKMDALAVTDWARDFVSANTLASPHPDDDLRPFDSIHGFWQQPKPLDLNSIDYEKWRDDHRDWFAQELQWMFKVHTALKDQQGIDADYIELLMVSGDIWQFNYPRSINQPIPIFSAAAIKQIAMHYGANSDRLLEAVDANMPSLLAVPMDQATMEQSHVKPLAEAAKQYQSALHRWYCDIVSLSGTTENKAPAQRAAESTPSDVLLFTLRAGTYLMNTRTAAWAWAHEHPREASACFRTWQQQGMAFLDSGPSATFEQLLDGLNRDITTAESISRIATEILTSADLTRCDLHADALVAELVEAVAALLTSDVPR